MRARTWQRELDRLGVIVPFAMIHDLGLVLSAPAGSISIGPRCDFQALAMRNDAPADIATEYLSFIESAFETISIRRRRTPMSDLSVSAALVKLFSSVSGRIKPRRPYSVSFPNDTALFDLTGIDLAALWGRGERRFELYALKVLRSNKLIVLAALDALDLDALSLVDSLGGGVDSQTLIQLVNALGDPATRDIVGFSLDVLPSVLETKTAPSASTHATSGYSGVGRRGSVDSLVLSELAWDDLEFLRRAMDDELLFYTRDRDQDETRRMHWLLVDASASMRGERSMFARGLALAAAKQLTLAGDEVLLRFFDANLYEPVRAQGREIPASYVLGFKGERGRNPTRVLSLLASELTLHQKRDPRESIVHLFTYGASHVPRHVIESLRKLAKLTAVFVAPRDGKVDVEYLDLLDKHWTVSGQSIAHKTERAQAARAILEGNS